MSGVLSAEYGVRKSAEEDVECSVECRRGYVKETKWVYDPERTLLRFLRSIIHAPLNAGINPQPTTQSSITQRNATQRKDAGTNQKTQQETKRRKKPKEGKGLGEKRGNVPAPTTTTLCLPVLKALVDAWRSACILRFFSCLFFLLFVRFFRFFSCFRAFFFFTSCVLRLRSSFFVLRVFGSL